MIFKKYFSYLTALLTLLCVLFSISCKTTAQKEAVIDEYKEFLQPDPEAEELFRVLIISDRYVTSQMKYHDKIERIQDSEGDQLITDKLKDYDKIDEICEGILTAWLYPETGRLMKIRPKTIAPIAEVNNLIMEDLKRWNFKFTGAIEPNVFDIKYRVVLRKIQSDEEIMKEVLEREKKKNGGSDD